MCALFLISFLMRSGWLLASAADWCTNKHRDASHNLLCPCFMILRVANRLSGLFFFSAFSIVAIFWAEVLSHARKTAANRAMRVQEIDQFSAGGDEGGSLLTENVTGGPERDCCSPRTLFTLLNVWIYIVEIVVLCLEGFGQLEDETYAVIHTINYLTLSGFFVLLTLAMICVGRSIRLLLRASGARNSDVVYKIFFVLLTCTVCFTMRSVLFSWKPLTGHDIPQHTWKTYVYPVLLYPVPEILPSIVLFWTMSPKCSVCCLWCGSCCCFCCRSRTHSSLATADPLDYTAQLSRSDGIGSRLLRSRSDTGSINVAVASRDGADENGLPPPTRGWF